MLTFLEGSMYGWFRNWMGVENVSMLIYTDPDLYNEMAAYLTDYFITLIRPVLKKVKFDLVCFFEDCCGTAGPLSFHLISTEKYWT
jgi:hypothetical protein